MTADARNVLIAELLGEVDTLLKRVERIAPDLEGVHARLTSASAEMGTGIDKYRLQISALSDAAQKSAVNHIIRRTNEVCEASLAAHTAAMGVAAKAAFDAEFGLRIDGLVASLDSAAHRAAVKPWHAWLMHLGTAVAASTVTAVVMVLVLSR